MKFKYFLAFISLIIIGLCIVFNIPLYYGFLFDIIMNAFYYVIFDDYTIMNLLEYIKEGILEHKIIYVIILLIGAIVSVWISSGIVPSLIFFGFDYFSPDNFLVIAFVFTSIVGIFMGTALGTITTVGIAVLAIGQGFGIDKGILLGAIVSGSFLADKLSPLSGLLNLQILATKTTYKKMIKKMMGTLVPVYFLTLTFFYFVQNHITAVNNMQKIESFKSSILSQFNISIVLLMIPLIVIFISFIKKNVIFALSSGVILGSLSTIIFQKVSLIEMIRIIIMGFQLNGNGLLSKILISGGVYSMVEVVFIVMGALGLTKIFEKVGVINELAHLLIKNIKNQGDLILKTSLISSLLTIVSCDQTVGIIIPSKLFEEKYKEFHLEPSMLARTISDTGVIIAPLMPWNVNVIIFSQVIGLESMKYIFFSMLCILFPVVTIIYGLYKKIVYQS